MQAQQELERYTQDRLWFEQHHDELLQRYPERWVGIYNQQVVAAAKDLGRFIRQIKTKGIPPGDVYREYLTEEETLLIP